LNIRVPAEQRSATLLDGKGWDGSDPAGYARSFTLHALADSDAVAL
jgi:nitrate/nitrite transport system substrate-binding protein